MSIFSLYFRCFVEFLKICIRKINIESILGNKCVISARKLNKCISFHFVFEFFKVLCNLIDLFWIFFITTLGIY